MATELSGADESVRAIVRITYEGVPEEELVNVTPREVVLAESLLTQSTQTIISNESYMYDVNSKGKPKNLDLFKGSQVTVNVKRPVLKEFGFPWEMNAESILYRLDNRKPVLNVNVLNVEDYNFHACNIGLLKDAMTLVSKSWKCTSPSDIVTYVLNNCLGIKNVDVEKSTPSRDYIAENIHPFQVIAQQAEVALATGDDPSFIHYATFENGGTHHFRSLKSLTKEDPVISLYFSETALAGNKGYADPHSVLSYAFPCDFDLLSDVLNGIGPSGQSTTDVKVFNPTTKSMSQLGNQSKGCGMGSGSSKIALTNQGSSKNQNSCDSAVEKYLLKRQARMLLLEKDKVALRLTLPWNPILSAGKMIEFTLFHKEIGAQEKVYGSGKYLIVSVAHTLLYGGLSITTIDCVADTVGGGIL